MQFQQHRHHRFGGLAGKAAFVGQVKVLYQLLGQGAAALNHMAGRGVDPHRTGDRFWGNPEMVEELAILDRDQGFNQIGRHLLQLDQHAIFLVRGVKPPHQHGFQAGNRQIAAVGLAQAGDVITGKAHTHTLGRFAAFIELKTARM
ncbi:hypothetical protein D9M68_745850 [compost metagenome]